MATWDVFKELASYYRQFTMPESLDHEKAKAGVCQRYSDSEGTQG